MSAYLDTSFLVPIYVAEEQSGAATEVLSGLGRSAAVSLLTDVELAAALHKHLSTGKHEGYRLYRQDRADGLYRVLAIDDAVFEEARLIAETYAGPYFLRSLDIVQLAVARRHGATQIGTFDRRMADAAKAMGLAVLPARS